MAQVGLLEDNTRIAKLCATMLQYAGHHAVVYTHPRQCLEALLSHPETRSSGAIASVQSATLTLPVDVLMLDLHLPDINGLDVLRSLLADERTNSLPLIFCTAATPSEVALALSLAPRASFIEKPFTFQQLVSTVALALNS